MKASEIYRFELEEHTEDRVLARVHFDASHPVYGGHFPGFPLTPGVCQLALVREALEQALNQTLRLKTAKYLKFTRMHNPSAESSLVLELRTRKHEEGWAVDASLSGEEGVYFKCRSHFAQA